jgi:hypothetical protein
MHCRRCKGLMVPIRMNDSMSGESVAGWKCFLCGETTDAGIEKNRQRHKEPDPVRARLPGDPVASRPHLR